jgi:Flp pilus assembly protein TadG
MRQHRSRGQALVEFSLILPIFLVMLMGVVDVGRAIWAQSSLAAAAREGARFAIVHGGTANNTCPVGTAASTANVPLASSSCPYPSPSKQAIRDAVTAMATAGGTSLTVTVCYGTNCSGDTDAVGTTGNNGRGNPVTVGVTSRINLLTPSLLGMNGFGISSVTTMVVNH